MTVERICIREVDTARQDESANLAARRMLDRKVGTLVVVDDASKPVGLLTDRDIAIRVVAKGLDPFTTSVGEVMTAPPRTIPQGAPLEAALGAMRISVCRRLPVVDDEGRLVGLISLDDILDLLAEEFGHIGKLLAEESPRSLCVPARP